jgi:hypothetical protein
MAQPTQTDLRELILTVAQQQEPQNQMGPSSQQGSVLETVARHLGVRQNPDLDKPYSRNGTICSGPATSPGG